jgi:hypothetical protein
MSDDKYGNHREAFAPQNNDWNGQRSEDARELDAQQAPAELNGTPNVVSELDSTQVYSASSMAAIKQRNSTSND